MEHGIADIQYCERLFDCFYDIGSTENGGVTRLGYTKQEDQMHEMFAKIGEELHCQVEVDEVGNTYVMNQPDREYCLIGSHLDSVIEGGRYDGVDIVIVRENSEDLYAGIEFEEGSEGARKLIALCEEEGAGAIRPDSGISVKPISKAASERIVRFAFDYARRHGRRKVTAVHKANIMKHTDGLFLRAAREVAAGRAEDAAFEERIVDAFCMNMVMDPAQFDVVVFPNLYGDIASDLAAGLVGGLGIAPGANIGDEYAVFEAVHGSAPDIAGQDKANPTAQILSAAMMLDYLGEAEAAERIRRAVRAVYAEGAHLTADIRKATGSSKPAASCTEFTDALIAAF